MFESKENMDLLMNDAKKRLEAQQMANDNVADNEDLYAEFFDEQDNTEKSYEQNTNNYNGDFEIDYNKNYHEEDYDIDNTGETLWLGGPTKSMIQLWKKQFGDYDVFYVEVADERFIIRSLNRHEYKSITSIKNSNALNREEMICETVVLYPLNYSFEQMAVKRAGIPSSLAEIIMKKSGFTKDYIVEVI